MAALVLLVEDKDSLRTMLRLALEAEGHAVVEARGQAEAVQALGQSPPALVLTDLRLPDGDGFGVLRAAKESDPDLPVVVMTAYGSIQDAVAAMKQGALDFLAKPVEPDHLRLLVERALERRRLLTENLLLREELAERRGMPVIIGESASLRQVSAALQRAAGTDTTVLLEGESGTGKELFARALHALGARADGPFVAINCAAIPDHLLESELFGYEKGAFTGADGRKIGKFELAHQGTFFLDEVGELPLALQAKLLRVLEQRTFERVGGTASIRVNVRLVAATNCNLRGAVASRRFREDLFFRLSVFPITVPPLRDRPEDVPVLARHFVARFCREMKKPVLELSQEAEEALRRYHWPGNVRELQNAVERAVILAEGTVLLPHNLVPAAPDSAGPDGDPWASIDLSGTLADASARVQAEVERRKIVAALREARGDRAAASSALGLQPRALSARIAQLGLGQ